MLYHFVIYGVYIYILYQWFTNDVYITVYMIYGIWVSHGFFTYAVYIYMCVYIHTWSRDVGRNGLSRSQPAQYLG